MPSSPRWSDITIACLKSDYLRHIASILLVVMIYLPKASSPVYIQQYLRTYLTVLGGLRASTAATFNRNGNFRGRSLSMMVHSLNPGRHWTTDLRRLLIILVQSSLRAITTILGLRVKGLEVIRHTRHIHSTHNYLPRSLDNKLLPRGLYHLRRYPPVRLQTQVWHRRLNRSHHSIMENLYRTKRRHQIMDHQKKINHHILP